MLDPDRAVSVFHQPVREFRALELGTGLVGRLETERLDGPDEFHREVQIGEGTIPPKQSSVG